MDKEQTAKNIYYKLKDRAVSLSDMQKGRVVPELKTYGIESYREIIENPWRIIYRIQNNEVIIIAVIDGRRNLEDIIFDKILSK